MDRIARVQKKSQKIKKRRRVLVTITGGGENFACVKVCK